MNSEPEVLEIATRVKTDDGWRDLPPGEDAAELIAQGLNEVWVDILATPDKARKEPSTLYFSLPSTGRHRS